MAHDLPVRHLQSSKQAQEPSRRPPLRLTQAAGRLAHQAAQVWPRRWAQQTCKGGMARTNSAHATSSAAAIDTPSRTLRRASRHSRRLELMSVRQATPVAAMWITPGVVEGCMGAVLGQQARRISVGLCGHAVDGVASETSALSTPYNPHRRVLTLRSEVSCFDSDVLQ